MFRRGSAATTVGQAAPPPRAKVRFERGAFSLFFRPDGTAYKMDTTSSTAAQGGNAFDGIIVEVETTNVQDTPVASPILAQRSRDEAATPPRRPSKPEIRWDLDDRRSSEDRPFGRLEPRDSYEMGSSRAPSRADDVDKLEV